MASSLAMDQVRREVVVALPTAHMIPAAVMKTMKVVAVVLEPVAWFHIS